MNLQGKTVLITGATAGIGKATAIALARQGAHILFNSRNPERGETARQEIVAQAGHEGIEVFPCDLADLNSVRTFAQQVLDLNRPIDVLINNAGVWETRRHVTVDGHEYTLAVNHLAPFLLTGLLLDRLLAAAPSRIVNVSSGAHNLGRIKLDDIQAEQGFVGLRRYGTTKLMNILFTRELARRLADKGVSANSLHPGFVATRVARSTHPIMRLIVKVLGMNPMRGAATSVYLAQAPEVADISGEYFVKKKITQPTQAAQDDEMALALWEKSEALVGFSYPIK